MLRARFGRGHAALSRALDRGAAGAARAHGDVESHLPSRLVFGEEDIVSLGAEERAGGQLDLHGADYLQEFRLEVGLPVWRFQVRDLCWRSGCCCLHRQNTVSRQLPDDRRRKSAPRLELRPAFNFRHYEDAVDRIARGALRAARVRWPLRSSRSERRICRRSGCICRVVDASFTIDTRRIHQVVYRTELERGYDYQG